MFHSSKFALSLSLGLIAAGCASTPSDEGAAAGKSATQAATEIDQGISQLDATLSALDKLVTDPGPDLALQYKDFSAKLGQLESSASKVSELATRIDTRGKEYFARWDQQLAAIQSEDIRERSADRKEDVAQGFAKLQKHYAEARDEFRPLLSSLRDIRSALGADLTMDGLKSVKGTINDAIDDADDVKGSLHELSDNFRKLGVKLSQAGPPQPKS